MTSSIPFRLMIAFAVVTQAVYHSPNANAAKFERASLTVQGAAQGVIIISGEIEKGDAAAFEQVIYENWQDTRYRLVLLLDSPGGDLGEARKLGQVIRKIGFNTLVHEDAKCISACFVLYAAGFQRLGQLPLFASREHTSIGVHRAFIDRELMASLTPAEAQAVVRRSMEVSAASLREFDVPEPIIDIVQGTAAAAIRFLTDAELSTFMYPPWFLDLTNAQCVSTTAPSSEPPGGILQEALNHSRCRAMVLTNHRLAQSPPAKGLPAFDYDRLLLDLPQVKAPKKRVSPDTVPSSNVVNQNRPRQ